MDYLQAVQGFITIFAYSYLIIIKRKSQKSRKNFWQSRHFLFVLFTTGKKKAPAQPLLSSHSVPQESDKQFVN